MFTFNMKFIPSCRLKTSLLLFIILFSKLSLANVYFVGGSNGVEVENLPQNAVSIRVSGPNDFYQETEEISFMLRVAYWTASTVLKFMVR
jgi:hypothetical protein